MAQIEKIPPASRPKCGPAVAQQQKPIITTYMPPTPCTSPSLPPCRLSSTSFCLVRSILQPLAVKCIQCQTSLNSQRLQKLYTHRPSPATAPDPVVVRHHAEPMNSRDHRQGQTTTDHQAHWIQPSTTGRSCSLLCPHPVFVGSSGHAAGGLGPIFEILVGPWAGSGHSRSGFLARHKPSPTSAMIRSEIKFKD